MDIIELDSLGIDPLHHLDQRPSRMFRGDFDLPAILTQSALDRMRPGGKFATAPRLGEGNLKAL